MLPVWVVALTITGIAEPVIVNAKANTPHAALSAAVAGYSFDQPYRKVTGAAVVGVA